MLEDGMEAYAADRGRPACAMLDAVRVIEQVRDQAMFLVDVDGFVASWNEGVGLILGHDEDDWIGRPLGDCFTPEDAAAGVPQAEMRQAAAAGRADDTRWMRRANGDHFFALGAMTRLLDHDGRLVGYLKMLRDHTGPKLAEQERERLLAAEGRARALAENQAAALTAAIEAIADGVCIGDARGIHRCNAAALAILGLDAARDLEVDGGGFVSLLRVRREREADALLPPHELPFERALQGETAMLEMWATRPDGGDVFMRCAAAPIRVDGQIAGAVAVYTDLTDRLRLDQTGRALTQVETELHERDAELRALIEGVRDYAIFTISPAGIISSWHPGASLMKGYSAEEAIGLPYAELFTPEDRAKGEPEAEMRVAAECGVYKGERIRLRKDGSRFPAQVVLTSLRGPDGELRGYLKLTQDITERRRTEAEREDVLRDAQAARAEAERASHTKGEFLATISHELRTPLSAILGWAHVLERGVFEPETVKHGLAAISRNARTQVQLIEDLLDMNRIESAQLRLDVQRIELGGVIAAAIDAALPAATAKGIGLRTVFGPEGGTVLGDAARLQQVVGNLLNNAIKFTPTGGQVSVALTQWGDQAQIAVADTGQGIEPEFLGRVFERFRQQDATTTRRHGGLGIGLAIVQQLVQLHGGTVRAHSLGPGQGSTFTVTLPAAGSAVVQPPSSPAAPPDPAAPAGAQGDRLQGVHVLLVDDEPDVRSVAALVLEAAGAEVATADGAGAALAQLARRRPTVIVSDIGMPDVDGYELMRRIRALPEEAGGRTPAVAYTAYARSEDRQRASEAGYQLHMGKQEPPQTLVQAVAALAGKP